ncbi:MAG: M3 family metallopeptidase [Mariniblastus sp.]|nr:M3 family metallopeptidase [Mariniblastus sp.]
MISLLVIPTRGVQAQDGDAKVIDSNVLIREWDGPYGGVPPWKSIKTDDFVAAFDRAIELSSADIDRIANNPAPPTFENTIVAMEKAGDTLTRVSNIFGVYSSNLNLGSIPDIEAEVMPKLSKHNDSIMQNNKLFQRVAAVHEGGQLKQLSPSQQRLVDDYYKSFVRQGAKLDAEAKAKLSQINAQLAGLFTQFSQNVLNDEQLVTIVNEESQLEGLPESVVDAMSAAAKQHAVDKKLSADDAPQWVINNTRSSMEPVLTYADNRPLREQVWKTYYSRGDNGDDNDTNEIITAILKLRAERAKLLGYPTHAHWRLEPQMAKNPENAMQLMMQVWPKAVARVQEEVADMQTVADESGDQITIEPWDYRYYAEKVRKDKYDLDFNEVKPYLQLEKLREGMMWAAEQIYGFQFKPVTNVPVFHPDVRVWEVLRKGKHIGLWYFDPYARRGKRSGAWMTDYRAQQNIDQPISTLVSNNSNFIKGKEGEPVLISWDDAVTLFHEFGHALHGLCSECEYPSQSGTSVARDYVEFPSQLNEHWLSTPEILEKFAVHYETGDPIPDELLEKIEKASTFNQGFATVEYLASALVDMKLHLAGNVMIEPDQFERETLQELGMPSEIVMRHRTPQFSHVFANDGYSAGYYSYLWSDALTADAADVFEDAGSYYDQPTASSLFNNIMSVGDTVDPAEGFRKFRGRDVDTKALLRKRGFPVD